jgi:hypothetical protein
LAVDEKITGGGYPPPVSDFSLYHSNEFERTIMASHFRAKAIASFAALLTTVSIAQAFPSGAYASAELAYDNAQYYQRPGYDPYYAPRLGPGNVCQQRVGDYFRVPSKHVRQLDTQMVGRGVYQISMSVQGRIVYCTVDAGGNVLNIQ